MSISYGVKKKVIVKNGKAQTLYYAVPAAIQKRGKGIDERRLAYELAERSSLTAGDALSVFGQLPALIVKHISNGRTIHIAGLGIFFPGITSEGCESPEDCTPEKVKVTRVCFRADEELIRQVKGADFFSIQFNEEKKANSQK